VQDFNSAMLRYFFHIRRSDHELVPDDEGAEFGGLEAAKHEAVETIRDLAAEAIKRGDKFQSLSIEIADDAGEVLDTIRARELFD
jgi:hypothetical protein